VAAEQAVPIGGSVNASVLAGTFFAAAIEVIEMVAIVVAVGVARSWRASLIGAAGGLLVLTVLIAVLGTALRNVPLQPVRLVVGALLLVFGLQWLRKGVFRVARDGWSVGQGEESVDAADVPSGEFDWTAFVLSFKGVSLEGLEVAVIVVAFGAAAGAIGSAVVGAAAAVLALGVLGASTYRLVAEIPRRALQLFVGVMLGTFGTFWSGQGLSVAWPGDEFALLWLAGLYVGVGLLLVHQVRRWLRAPAAPTRQPARGLVR
jgi:Ca2+/H+ antiporter, TMEM165/GDT1 family